MNDLRTGGSDHFESALLVKAEAVRQAHGDLGERAGAELEDESGYWWAIPESVIPQAESKSSAPEKNFS